MEIIEQTEPSAFEVVYRFEQCEVIMWKDGKVTITEPGKQGIITFRRAPNAWCGRD